mgnify:CR=1 FL=1
MSDKVIVVREESATWKALNIAALGLLGLAEFGGAGVILELDQLARYE